MKNKRAKSRYLNESQRNCLKVLRVLIGAPSFGYSVQDIHKQVSEFMSYAQCYTTLINLELEGFACQLKQGWKPANGLRLFAAHVDSVFVDQDADVLALADSMRP